jgi:flagellin
MTSIQTSASSLVALQTLKGINRGIGQVQSQVSTGLKVANARDNSSSWSIASTMDADIRSYGKLSESLNSASALLGTARVAAEQITGILKTIQEKVVQGKNPGADRTKLDAEITALTETINSIAASSQYNGVNLVEGRRRVTFTVALTRQTNGQVGTQRFSMRGERLERLTRNMSTRSSANRIDNAIDRSNRAAARFGAAQTRIDAQNEFLGRQMDSLKIGKGAMIDASMEAASARLQALQVQQQLGIQSLSIANQSPQGVLALFR